MSGVAKEAVFTVGVGKWRGGTLVELEADLAADSGEVQRARRCEGGPYGTWQRLRLRAGLDWGGDHLIGEALGVWL